MFTSTTVVHLLGSLSNEELRDLSLLIGMEVASRRNKKKKEKTRHDYEEGDQYKWREGDPCPTCDGLGNDSLFYICPRCTGTGVCKQRE